MIRFSSTLFAAVVLATPAALLRPAAAIEYPWCAQYGGGEDGGGGRNCGFSTYEQCMATISGMGGGCERNLFYQGPAEQRAKPPTKRKHHND
jgi:Protein of unknown function (DUF3551)